MQDDVLKRIRIEHILYKSMLYRKHSQNSTDVVTPIL